MIVIQMSLNTSKIDHYILQSKWPNWLCKRNEWITAVWFCINYKSSFISRKGSVETTFSSGITTDVKNNNVALGVSFTSGLASPEINKGSGDFYTLTIERKSQESETKEDIKIILEFKNATKTNLNSKSIHDDFSKDNQFYRVLFNPVDQ